MKIRNGLKSFLLMLLLATAANIRAQDINNLENKYDKTRKTFLSEKSKLDSLNRMMEQRVVLINSEKSKQQPDKDKIINLMSGSAIISNKIENHQKKIHQLEYQLENIKQDLNNMYSAKIDSLKSLKKSDSETSALIYFYTEKKILYSPKVNTLSFNPEKILQIDPSSAKSNEEKRMFMEYLNNALAEVEMQIKVAEDQSSEINQIITLQRKASRFLEESEFENNLPTTSKRGPDIASNNYDRSGFDNSPITEINKSLQMTSYYNILNQLKVVGNLKVKYKTYDNFKLSKDFTMEDYLKIVKEVKKTLQDYKLILSEKIKKAK